jgi:putative Mg2+ transporter-C (MgtC) family protein
VILHEATNGKVHGLTTAVSTWVTAALGVLCGLGAWKLVVVAVAGVLFLLVAGGSIEKWCQKALGVVEKADPPDSR